MYTKTEMECLTGKASDFTLPSNRFLFLGLGLQGEREFEICTCFYRDKDQWYYNHIFENCDGIMKKYQKDCHGDPANPINEQISGLFFSATMHERYGGPLSQSTFGDRRVEIQPSKLLNENTNLYFADFYCIYRRHWVLLVLAENRTEVDDTCSQLLIKLDKYKNPFLYISKTDPMTMHVATGVAVEVFYTHDINLPACGINNTGCVVSVMPSGPGKSTMGGKEKKKGCSICTL